VELRFGQILYFLDVVGDGFHEYVVEFPVFNGVIISKKARRPASPTTGPPAFKIEDW